MLTGHQYKMPRT